MKSKFYQKNGLTVYALDSCFHVRTFGNWQCLDTINEARKAWQIEVKRVFNKELKAYKAQKRARYTKQAAEVLAGALVLLDPETTN